MQAYLVPCWWIGWWLWRAGCISQDTYLFYIIIFDGDNIPNITQNYHVLPQKLGNNKEPLQTNKINEVTFKSTPCGLRSKHRFKLKR